jgi:IMP dehydrogenase
MTSMMEEGLTYEDVLLVPRRSSIRSRKEVDTNGAFSRRIRLAVPIVAANMDTVTESEMAISMARLGGLGVVHRFLSIGAQVEEVSRVKRAESVVIDDPYTLPPEATVSEARKLMRRHHVGGLLIVDKARKPVGILTTRDLLFAGDGDSSVSKLMTTKLVTAKQGVASEEAAKILRKHKIEKLPVIAKDGKLAGLITAQDMQKRRDHPFASKDSKGRLLVGGAVGVVDDFLERSVALADAGVDVLVVDVAHGHADHVIDAVEAIKKRLPDVELVAGNVATFEGARDLAGAGADGIKVGVGPGATCTTRIVTGSGVPQLSAVMDCAKITREKKIPICADGGIRDSGDITKALAAGASSVMVGQLLAGTEESPGWTIVRKGMRYKVYRGMASLGASLGRRQREAEELAERDVSEVVPEGVEAMVPYRGTAAEVIHQLHGGLRSGMSYSGARTLPELWKRAKFMRMTGAGWRESKPHAVE